MPLKTTVSRHVPQTTKEQVLLGVTARQEGLHPPANACKYALKAAAFHWAYRAALGAGIPWLACCTAVAPSAYSWEVSAASPDTKLQQQ